MQGPGELQVGADWGLHWFPPLLSTNHHGQLKSGARKGARWLGKQASLNHHSRGTRSMKHNGPTPHPHPLFENIVVIFLCCLLLLLLLSCTGFTTHIVLHYTLLHLFWFHFDNNSNDNGNGSTAVGSYGNGDNSEDFLLPFGPSAFFASLLHFPQDI